MRARTGLLALAAAIALVAGCANSVGGGGSDGVPGTAPDDSGIAPDSAVDLIGLWRVTGAAGESESTWLRLDERDFVLVRDCGVIFGSWQVRGGLLLADSSSASGTCSDGVPDIPWLSAAVGYTETTAGFELIDADGDAVASLQVDGAPEPRDDLAESYFESPQVTDATRAWLATPALQDGLTPAGSEDLVGRWAPEGPAAATDAHVEFAGDGSWTGSDGCNGGAGRWAVGEGGAFVATSGLSTLMACDGAAVPAWVAGSAVAGLDGGALVLIGSDGVELGRVVPA